MHDDPADEIAFAGAVIEWRGPAPFYFVEVPDSDAGTLRAAAKRASYGWGCVPVIAMIDGTEFRTSLMPRRGSYVLPLKAAVRRIVQAAPGEIVSVVVRIACAVPDTRQR